MACVMLPELDDKINKIRRETFKKERIEPFREISEFVTTVRTNPEYYIHGLGAEFRRITPENTYDMVTRRRYFVECCKLRMEYSDNIDYKHNYYNTYNAAFRFTIARNPYLRNCYSSKSYPLIVGDT